MLLDHENRAFMIETSGYINIQRTILSMKLEREVAVKIEIVIFLFQTPDMLVP